LILAVSTYEPNYFVDGTPSRVIEAHHTPDREELIGEKEVRENIIEVVVAIDVN
jgi:hypothetical protein